MSAKRKPSDPALIDASVTSVAEELRRIAEANDGFLAPDVVVEEARSPTSPLHDYFLWDDTEAAENWRRAQAGMLIRRVKLHIVKAPANLAKLNVSVTLPDVSTVRAYESRPSARNKDGGYETVTDIMADPDKRAELLESAKRELRGLQRRYSGLTELASVWEALDAL